MIARAHQVILDLQDYYHAYTPYVPFPADHVDAATVQLVREWTGRPPEKWALTPSAQQILLDDLWTQKYGPPG